MKPLISLIAATCVVGAVFGQQPSQSPKPDPGYKAWEVWVGDWEFEGEGKDSPMGPGGKFSGKATGRWILNGFFLEWRWQEKGDLGDLECIEFDWYDAGTKRYRYQGYQSDGAIFSGSATISGNVWNATGTLTHRGVQYKVRQLTTFAADGMSYAWKAEISTDGKTWVPWAEDKATKIKTAPLENASVGQELIKLEKDWAEAVVKRDLAFLDGIWADDYAWTASDGKVWSKAETLASLKSGEDVVSSCVTDDFKVRVYGDTAIVTARSTFNETLHGKDISAQERGTDTWIKRAGRWQCVAMHCSKIAQQPTPPPKPAPEMKDWEVWVGDWMMEGTAKDSPTEPEYKVDWRLPGRWILGSFFVQVDHIWRGKGVEQHWLEILSYDPIKKIHASSGFTSDGMTWIATTTFTDGTSSDNGTTTTADGRIIKWSNTWVFSDDRMSVSGTQESEQDGVRWTSFSVKGTKAKAAPNADLAAEEGAIRALFERHRLAIESKNLAAWSQTFDHSGPLLVVFGEGEPMMDWSSVERANRDWFAAADEIRMKDTCLQVRVHPSGLAAWASYLTDETETTKGTNRTEHLRATFGLEKHGPTWVVVQAHWSAPLTPSR